MKIGIDIRCLMNEKYSGVAWYTYNLIMALLKLDQANEYVLFYNSSKLVKLPAFDFTNIRPVGFRWPNKLFNLSLIFFGQPKLDRLIGGVDVFFTPNLHFVSWSNGCKKVAVVHDLSFLANPIWFTLKQRLWHKLILRNKILQEADIIIADSENTKDDLVDLLGVPAEKIRVVYLGVFVPLPFRPEPRIMRGEVEKSFLMQGIPPLASLARDDKGVRVKHNLPDKYFLFVGTIEPRKNVLGIIKAWQKLNQEVGLVLAGDWGWKVAEVERLVVQNKNIILLGYVPEEDKITLYQSAIALVYPSFYEGFGLPILEAMANGCPVICGNNSSQGEVLGDCGLLVNPDNLNEISHAIELMLTDENLRQDFISRGKERAKEFTWQKTASQVLEIFNQTK